MNAYQLRIPTDLGVDGISSALALRMRAALASLGGQVKQPAAFTRSLGEALVKHLVSFDTCGCSSLCDEPVTPVAWNLDPPAKLMSSDPRHRDQVLRLHFRFSKEGFHRFSVYLARTAAHAAVVPEGRALLVEEELEKSVYHALSPYLFESPLCHTLDLCGIAKPLQLSLAAGA